MGNFEDFIVKPVSNKIALLEAEPGLCLELWTLDSGSIYYASFNEIIINDLAIISQVKQNSAALTKANSKETMSPGCWYQDVSAGRLYVWCSGSVDPNTVTIIAYFKVYFGTEEIIFNDNFYQGRIPEGGISLTAAGELIDGGEITLLNGDGWFDKRMASWVWRGVRVNLLLGGDDLAYADYEKICHLRVQGLEWNNDAVRMSIKGMKIDWRKKLPINETYTEEEILRPDANGYYNAWTGDYTDVDEEDQPKGNTWKDYIKLTSGYGSQSFTFPDSNLPDNAVINYVIVYSVTRVKLNADHVGKVFIRLNGNESYHSFGHCWPWNSWEVYTWAWSFKPGTVEPWTKSDINSIEAGVYGDVKVAEQELYCTQFYLGVNYSVMREYDEGKPMPILYGEGELTPVLEDEDYYKGKFRIADGTVQSLKEITWVKYEDVEIQSADLEKNLSQCWFAIKDTWQGTIKDPANVRVKVQGAKICDIPNKSSEDMISCASDILRHLCQRVMGYSEAELDTVSFDNARSTDQECRLFITSLTYTEDVINWVKQSVRGVFGQNREGKIYFKLWSEDASSALVIDCDREALELRVTERQGPVCDRAICKYARDADTGKWLFASQGDSAPKYIYAHTEPRAFETALAKKSDAAVMAHDFRQSHQNPIMECELVVKLQAAKVEVGDKVKLTRSRAPDGTGSWTEKVFQVKKVQREPGNRIRLLLEPNLPCLDYQLQGFEDAENPDMQQGMQCALAVYDKSAQQVKTSKVVAESIKQDEALRRQDIVTTQVLANNAQAVVHGLDYPPEYIVSMFSSNQGSVYSHVSPFTDLTNFVSGWHIQTIATAEMLNQATDGNMEAEDTNAYEAVNNATLTKETGTPHGGQRCLRVRAETGKSYGGAKQIITTLVPGPASLNPAGLVDGRVWARAPVGGNSLFRLYSGPVANPTAHLIGEIQGYSTSWEELTLLRKMMPAGDKRVVAILYIEGNTDTFYAEFDDLDVCWAEKCVHVANIGGVDKDFKVRIFKEQAGS